MSERERKPVPAFDEPPTVQEVIDTTVRDLTRIRDRLTTLGQHLRANQT